jgi:hypothetical protein
LAVVLGFAKAVQQNCGEMVRFVWGVSMQRAHGDLETAKICTYRSCGANNRIVMLGCQ